MKDLVVTIMVKLFGAHDTGQIYKRNKRFDTYAAINISTQNS